MSTAPRVPTFIGIGAQKAGTSWLDRVLRSCPDIWLPPVKELHYFDRRESNFPTGAWARMRTPLAGGRHWRNELRNRIKATIRYMDVAQARWTWRYFFGVRDDVWYRSLFAPAEGKVCGEITPEYCLLGDEPVARLARVFPRLRAVLLVREPVARCWSHVRMDMAKSGSVAGGQALLANIDEFFASSHCLSRSDYVPIIDRWSAAFGERFMWAYSEDISEQPEQFLHRFRQFVGLAEAPFESSALIASRVGVGRPREIPQPLADFLEQRFRPVVLEMQRRFGRVPAAWLEAHGLRAEQTDG
ncbi:MAG: sulfotransferase [Pseudomarimonas sp.]